MSDSAKPLLVVTSLLSENGKDVELLPAINDDHGGVIVELETPMDSQTFSSSLRASLSNWKKKGIKGVWIKLPINLSNLVQPAVEEGFWYHHAERSYLMLVYWIPDTENTIPCNATHRVGVGAFVMNERREGEDIHAGAVREVKEETGIDTEFVEVLAFRQSHMSFFQKSDLFFVCMLRPLSFEIHKQEIEIEAAQWMPIEEFLAQPFVQKHELLKYIVEVSLAKVDGSYAGFSPISIKSGFSDAQHFLYLNRRDLNQQ
ncbi:nudix hydrolase 2-like isoform X2 [Typha latifolia]|uniref:nudix hydrolase 2-like isoform X2 n=1 Tax=Typha latifolia TaxID=4733 RepID=UPI003C2E4EDB